MITSDTDLAIRAVVACLIDTGISPNKAAIMLALVVREKMTMKQVSEVCGFTTAAGTGLIRSMLAEGLVKRRHSNGDLRNVYVTLTDRGRRMCQSLVNRVDNHLREVEL